MKAAPTIEPGRDTPAGAAFITAAYLWWAGSVFYFKAVAHVPPAEVLVHRVVWSVLFTVAILIGRRRAMDAFSILADRRTALLLSATTGLMGLSWFTFIWAISHDMVLHTSLGYFISPLVKVLLGYLFLRERLDRAQTMSVVLAFCAVLILTIKTGHPPLIALVLAITFSLYGLLRKKAGVEGVQALAIETAILLPFAAAYFIYLGRSGGLVFTRLDRSTDLLLLAAGPATAIPLIWYGAGVLRLRLITVGFIQYLMPTITFLSAVFVFREPFSAAQLASFVFVWTALAIYLVDTVRRNKRQVRHSDRRAVPHS